MPSLQLKNFPLLLLLLRHPQLLAASFLFALNREIVEESVNIIHGRHIHGKLLSLRPNINIILGEERMITIYEVEDAEQEGQICQLFLDQDSKCLNLIDIALYNSTVSNHMDHALMKFIGYLLARRRIGELNNFYFIVPRKPYLACSNILHKLQRHDILFVVRHKPFVALHGFIVRLLIVHRLVELVSAEHNLKYVVGSLSTSNTKYPIHRLKICFGRIN